ncbi:MAG: hypothetical protein PHU53_04870 [Thermoplasmata archaeon]|nr:hypothetical protein [Thermoplasmata archaeon]
MFKLRQLMNRQRYEMARQTGINIDNIQEERMHNVCELNEKSDIVWSAGMNL